MPDESPLPADRKLGTRPTRRWLVVSVGLILVVALLALMLTPAWEAHEKQQRLENLQYNVRLVTMVAMAMMLDKGIDTVTNSVDTVTYNDLIKLNYIPPVSSVYGEDYSKLVFSLKQDWIELVGGDGRQFWFHVNWDDGKQYPPPVAGPFSSANLHSPINPG